MSPELDSLLLMHKVRLEKIKNVIVASLREHGVFIGIVCIYCLSVKLIGVLYGVSDSIDFRLYSPDLLLYVSWFVEWYFVVYSLYVMVFIRPKRLIIYLYSYYLAGLFQSRKIVSGLIVLISLPLFLSAFTSMKSIAPVLNPFLWDKFFAHIDYLLHFGFQPWQLLQPLLQIPLISFCINFLYNFWLYIVNGILIWQIFDVQNKKLRMQYLLSFLLVWVLLGSILGICFASVGPCFYGKVVAGENPFIGLMEYLRMANEQYPIWAVSTQDALWKGYKVGEITQGSGISAMPSLHVATSVLFALLGWRTNKILGIVFTLYGFIILIGSVHLGWHYAIDGYVSIILTVLIWKGVGRFIQNREQRTLLKGN